MEEITAEELLEKLENQPHPLEIIDVREKPEYDLVHLKHSKLMPLSEIDKYIPEIDWSKEVIFVCRSGARSGRVAEAFFELGSYGKSLKWGLKSSLMLKDYMEMNDLDPSFFS